MTDRGRIQVLPTDAAERIAAGEVIERPASVVKELVENSLDAGATRITVEVEASGLRLIRVTDDGEGIAGPDLPRAFQRFATSKIRTAADLEVIETYGFRGEALPSIAAVARVEMLTSVRGAPAARLRIEGGRPPEVEPAAGPPGTAVQVRALFFNTPARRKFLKSPARELSVIVETVQGLALAAPEAAFRLVSDGRELLWYPAERFRDRARRVLGPGVAAALDLDAQVAGGSLQGVLGTPQAAQPRRTHQWFLVNRRPVRSPLLARALSHAYHTLIPEDRYPAAVLAVRLPAVQVDANVHPRKAEVRFAQEGRVFEEVVREVGGALRRTALVHVVRTRPGPGAAPGAAPRSRPPAPPVRAADGPPGGVDPQRAPEDAAGRGPQHATVAPEPVEQPVLPLEPAAGWPRIRVLGQYALTYIVGESGGDLLLIDQHAAHERVLFERLLDRRAREGARAQDLVTPVAVTLSPADEAALEECRPALEEIGFGVEPFGPGLARLTAVPAIAAARAPDALFRACLQDLQEESGRHAGRSLVERLAIATACHTAVRAGDRLDPAGIAALIEALGRAGDPYSCFHGRPTMVRVPRQELDRWFYRRV